MRHKALINHVLIISVGGMIWYFVKSKHLKIIKFEKPETGEGYYYKEFNQK